MGGEFLEREFFRGPLLLEKQSQKIRPKNSGPKFGRPKFVSQNSGLNSGSGDAKSPVQTFVPENRGERQNRKTAIIAICFGLLGPFQTITLKAVIVL